MDKRKFWIMSRKYATFAILIFIIIVMSFLSDRFLMLKNLTNVARQISFNAIISVGMTIVIISGGIDLSVGGITGLCGCICARIVMDTNNVMLAVFVALLVGLLIGIFNGVLVSYTGLAPFIITLSSLSIAKSITLVFTNASPIPVTNEAFKLIGQSSIGVIPTPIIIMLCVFVIAAYIMKKTKFGRYIYAIGGNEKSAAVVGIRVRKLKLSVYMISSFLAAMVGIIYTSRLSSGVPTLGEGFEMDAITAAVIGGASLSGGQGDIWGTIIGAVIIGILNNALNLLNVNTYYQGLVTGAVVLFAVLFDRFIQTRVRSSV